MEKKRSSIGWTIWSIGFLLFSVGCASIPVQSYDHSTNGTNEVMTYQAHFWDGDCATKAFNIRMLEKPSNGTITIKDVQKTIGEGADLGTNQFCSGKK